MLFDTHAETTVMVNFTAIFSHHLDVRGVCDGAALLNLHWPKVSLFVSRKEMFSFSEKSDDYWQWEPRWGISPMEDLQRVGYVTFAGQEGFRARFAHKTFMLQHFMQWHSFLTNDKISSGLRSICSYIAKPLESDRVIYLPDSGWKISNAHDLAIEGADLDTIITWLGKTFGPSARSLHEIYPNENDPKRGEGYFIDKFDFQE